MRRRFLLPALLFAGMLGAQHEIRMEHAGAGVNGGQPESSFLVHRLGNDHADSGYEQRWISRPCQRCVLV